MVIDDKYAMLILTSLDSHEKRLNEIFPEPMMPLNAEHFDKVKAEIADLQQLIKPILVKQVNWNNVNKILAERGLGPVTFLPDGNVRMPKFEKGSK